MFLSEAAFSRECNKVLSPIPEEPKPPKSMLPNGDSATLSITGFESSIFRTECSLMLTSSVSFPAEETKAETIPPMIKKVRNNKAMPPMRYPTKLAQTVFQKFILIRLSNILLLDKFVIKDFINGR